MNLSKILTVCVSIFLRYFYSGSDLRYFTDEKCKLIDWDSDKMKFKRSHEGWQNANERLSKLRSDLESAAHHFKLQRIIPTPQQLKDCIAPQSVKKEIVVNLSIVGVYDDFYKHSENEGKKLSTLKSLKTTRNHLAQFCAINPLHSSIILRMVFTMYSLLRWSLISSISALHKFAIQSLSRRVPIKAVHLYRFLIISGNTKQGQILKFVPVFGKYCLFLKFYVS